MIDLHNAEPFASGGNRHCYRHPQFSNRCVKVMRPGRVTELRKRAPWYKKLGGDRQFDDNVREEDGYHQKVLNVAGPESPIWAHLPRWYGMEETSVGAGAVSELIRDVDGAPGITLEDYLQQYGLDDTIRGALQRFSQWLRATGVLTKNLLPHNLVLSHRHGRPELFLIDGLGNAAFLPFAEYFTIARRRYIERRIKKMWTRIHWEISDRSLSWTQTEKLSRR